MATTRIDLVGKVFGLLTVVGESHSTNSVYWRVRCSCGTECVRRGGDLMARQRRGLSQSCGCAKSRVSDDGSIRCGSCKKFKTRECFNLDLGALYGVHGHCKTCQGEWRESNRDLLRSLSTEWRSKNADRCREVSERYRKNNPEKYAANEARRRAAKLMATPAWADVEKIKLFYSEAQRLGVEVDHIVPLRSKFVCGLHVEHNLQLLDRPTNASKNNRFWPDMP